MRFARAADASDIGPRHPARYGQNDREIALNRKNALFAGHDEGASYCPCDNLLINQMRFVAGSLTAGLYSAFGALNLRRHEYLRDQVRSV